MQERQGVDTGGFGDRSGWSAGKIIAAIVGLGCLALIVLMATCVGGGALWWKRTSSSVKAEVKPFLMLLAEDEYERAYSQVADSWKAKTPFEKFRDDFSAIHERLGNLEDLRIRGLRMEGLGDSAFREVTFLGTYEKGEAIIRVRLEPDETGTERISGVRFDFRVAAPEPPEEPESVMDRDEVSVVGGSEGSDESEDAP
jgi:hypothetical protein